MNIMDYQVEKEKPKTKGLVIKKFTYDKNIGKNTFHGLCKIYNLNLFYLDSLSM